MVTVGSILRETAQFVRSNIQAILAWSVLSLAIMLLMAALMLPIYQAQLATLQSGIKVAPELGVAFWLLIPLLVFVGLMIGAATFRAVLLPAESRFFYLRIGMDEVRLLGLVLIIVLIAIVMEIAVTIVAVIPGLLVSMVFGSGWGILIGVLIGLAALCGMIWALVRLSPAAPLTILERKIIIGPAWRLSRGRFWTLFGAYFVIALVIFVISIAMTLAQMGPVMGDMFRVTDPTAQQRVAEWQVAHAQLGFPMLIYAIISYLIYGMVNAVYIGMTAVATRQLLVARDDAAPPEAPTGPWSN